MSLSHMRPSRLTVTRRRLSLVLVGGRSNHQAASTLCLGFWLLSWYSHGQVSWYLLQRRAARSAQLGSGEIHQWDWRSLQSSFLSQSVRPFSFPHSWPWEYKSDDSQIRVDSSTPRQLSLACYVVAQVSRYLSGRKGHLTVILACLLLMIL